MTDWFTVTVILRGKWEGVANTWGQNSCVWKLRFLRLCLCWCYHQQILGGPSVLVGENTNKGGKHQQEEEMYDLIPAAYLTYPLLGTVALLRWSDRQPPLSVTLRPLSDMLTLLTPCFSPGKRFGIVYVYQLLKSAFKIPLPWIVL